MASTISGAQKFMAVPSASGTIFNTEKKISVEASSKAPRPSCSPSRFDFRMLRPWRRRYKGANVAAMKNRLMV